MPRLPTSTPRGRNHAATSLSQDRAPWPQAGCAFLRVRAPDSPRAAEGASPSASQGRRRPTRCRRASPIPLSWSRTVTSSVRALHRADARLDGDRTAPSAAAGSSPQPRELPSSAGRPYRDPRGAPRPREPRVSPERVVLLRSRPPHAHLSARATRHPGLSNGNAHPASRSRGATARAVTTSAAYSPTTSSARARRTVTFGQVEQVDALLQKDGTPQQRLQQRDGQIRHARSPGRCRVDPRPSRRR